MTADVELLPCPFCGNEVQDDEGCFQSGGFRSPATPVWSVRCGNPGCNADVSAASEATAVAAWNSRATAAKDAEIEALRERLRVQDEAAEREIRHQHGRAERLAEALREAADMLLADYPETAKRLRAALHPTAAQENGDE